jgi:hypothetical protein
LIEVVTKAGLTVILDFCQQLDLVVVNYDYRYYTLHNFHYLKVIIQYGYLTASLQMKETTQWSTQAYML